MLIVLHSLVTIQFTILETFQVFPLFLSSTVLTELCFISVLKLNFISPVGAPLRQDSTYNISEWQGMYCNQKK